jgi:hypothetical protein
MVIRCENQNAPVTAFEIGFDSPLFEVGQRGVGQAQGNKCFAHPDLIREDLFSKH